VEGSGGFRHSRGFEEGPGQKQEIKKWRGPVVSGSAEVLRKDPARSRKLKCGGVL